MQYFQKRLSQKDSRFFIAYTHVLWLTYFDNSSITTNFANN